MGSQNLQELIRGVEELQEYLAQGRKMAVALTALAPKELDAAGLAKTRAALGEAHNSMFLITARLESPQDFHYERPLE